MPEPLRPVRVSARDVGRLFGDTVALRDCSFDARSGDLVVIHGPNGSGKSTLLRLLAGLIEPTVGEIEWRRGPERSLPRIAMLAHATHLVDALTVRENVDLASRLARGPTSASCGLIDALDLAPVERTPVASLSAGTRRRAGLARAIAALPDVLIVDEPFAALDLASASMVKRVLENSARDGVLLVVACHDPDANGMPADVRVDLSRGWHRPPAAVASA